MRYEARDVVLAAAFDKLWLSVNLHHFKSKDF
jgi:hypothetical protein